VTAAFSPRVRTLNTRRGGGRPREARRVVRARGVWSGGVRGKPQLVRYEYIPVDPLTGPDEGEIFIYECAIVVQESQRGVWAVWGGVAGCGPARVAVGRA
jgi:hypothetical protein